MLQSLRHHAQKMIAQAVAADLGKRMFGDLVKGGEGSGWFGGALDWLGGLFKNADGGVWWASAHLARRYSGRIVDRPTVFPFARGVGLHGRSRARGHPAPQGRRRRPRASRRAVAATPSTSTSPAPTPRRPPRRRPGRPGSPGRVERSPPLWLSSWRSACRSGSAWAQLRR